MTNRTTHQKADRLTAACRNCRTRKVRCSGGQPCRDCDRLGKVCFYPLVQRRAKKSKSTFTSGGGRDQISDNQAVTQPVDRGLVDSNGLDPNSDHLVREQSNVSQSTPSAVTIDAHTLPKVPHSEAQSGPRTCESSLTGPGYALQTGSQRNGQDENSFAELSTDDLEGQQNKDHTGNSLRGTSWEYHEPWSWMSVCSHVGLKSIQDMTGYQDFGGIAARFTLDLARRWSSHDLTSIGSKWAQIEETTAWKYTNAFFEETWEAKLAIVHRDDFEALLREYFRGPAQKGHLAWFALRNTVFACGYRSILVKDPGVSFSEAQVKAGRLFNYALSVLTQILLPPSSLLAIQALTLMACYAEGLGNPALKHFLCSNAVHAAQNKGLHRQPEKSWGISEDEAAKRNGLWWTIYTLEKHLSMCSGRPSAIDDDNVSAYPPAGILSRSDIVPQSLFFATQHAQICSQISRNLLSARSLQLSTPELISTVNHFHQKLMKLLDEIPDELKIGTLARPDHPTPHLIHLLYLHFSIYGSLMVVHTHFFYPWMSSRLNATGAEAAMEGQIRISSTVVAEAARKIILAVRLVTTTVATPSWLAFYYPIYAHINLFIYMLKFPHLSTTAADLGLLDVCAGHFGHIDYLTSAHISISLPRETATLTSKFIKDMKVRSQQPAIQSFHEYPQPHPQAQADTSSQTRTAEDSTINFDEMSNDLPTISDNNDFLNLDAATWNIFSSFDMLTTNETDFRAF